LSLSMQEKHKKHEEIEEGDLELVHHTHRKIHTHTHTEKYTHTHTHTHSTHSHVFVYTHTRVKQCTHLIHTHPRTHTDHTHTHTGEARGASTILSSIAPRHRVGIQGAVFTQSRSIRVGKLAGLALVARSRTHGGLVRSRGANLAGPTVRAGVSGVAAAVGQLVAPRL
jgi:hypothetical protein